MHILKRERAGHQIRPSLQINSHKEARVRTTARCAAFPPGGRGIVDIRTFKGRALNLNPESNSTNIFS